MRTASKDLLFHGTSTGANGEVLRRILKEGLIPNPPQRVFDKTDILYESYAGTYLTPNLTTAVAVAWNRELSGEPLVVVAQIETRSSHVVLDEDELGTQDFWLLDYVNWSVDDDQLRALWRDPSKRDRYIRAVTRQRMELLTKNLGIQIPDEKYIWPFFTQAVEANTDFMLAMSRETTVHEYDSPDSEVDKIRITNHKYRTAIDRLLTALRKATHSVTKQSIRHKEPLTYRGANRIMAVVQLVPFRPWYRDPRLPESVLGLLEQQTRHELGEDRRFKLEWGNG